MALTDWILPKEDKFFEMLIAQSQNCRDAAKEFNEYVKKYSAASKAGRENGAKRIKAIEHKGDEITHSIIDKLNSPFITPLDKEDIHEVTGLLDDITDYINTAALHLILLDVKKTDACMQKLAFIILRAVEELHSCIVELRNLKSMKKKYISIHSLENEGDDTYHQGLASLFQRSRDPIDIMKRREIYELLEHVIDKCEDVADAIDTIVVKHG